MENNVIHRADTRGCTDLGWLKSYHTFSFAGYHNAARMHFGALRVLNDDTVKGGRGFGQHRHENMEIISIPLEGDLEHQDSLGNTTVIRKGDIQVMSAGTGVYHSEYNKNNEQDVQFLQIWILPSQRNVAPRYDQVTLKASDRWNTLQQILSPNAGDAGVWIHQDAWMHLGMFDQGRETRYPIKQLHHGVYVFVLSGSFEINEERLSPRDGMGIWNVSAVNIKSLERDAEILLIEVPMMLN